VLLAIVGCGGDRGREPAPDEAKWDAFLSEVKKYYPLRKPEGVIRHFFRDRRDGFFVDVGAAHYRNASTTYYLEEKLGWSGIAIDALEHWGRDYPKMRPGTKFFAYIVTDHAGTREPFFRMKGDIGSTALRDRVDAIKKLLPRAEVQEVLVPTITLDTLLDRESVTRIDLLSMDIEQGEPAALAGFDIERFAPELVCIEHLPEVEAALLDYFARHRYRRIERYLEVDGGNWYFTPTR
jgi:FkbM family methyltransferase